MEKRKTTRRFKSIRKRIILELPVKVVEKLDYLVETGYYTSRSEVIRTAISNLLDSIKDLKEESGFKGNYEEEGDEEI